MKIEGLEKLTRQLDEAQRAAEALDGDLGQVSFDPSDPGSIEAAIAQVESLVAARIGQWANNPIVADLASQLKAAYRQDILDRAAAARLQDTNDGQ